MCPTRLTRGVNSVIVGTVYHPPNANNSEMLNYITETVYRLSRRTILVAILLFWVILIYELNVRRLNTNYNLKQIVNILTRGQNILDLVLTNLDKFYEKPIKMSRFGLFDHVTIVVKPKKRGQDKVVTLNQL
jgi:hypothetical protein